MLLTKKEQEKQLTKELFKRLEMLKEENKQELILLLQVMVEQTRVQVQPVQQLLAQEWELVEDMHLILDMILQKEA